MDDNNKLFSYKATVMSFVMAIFVMYIHGNNIAYYSFSSEFTVAHAVEKLVGEVLGGLAVPLFFTMSAYWLFRYKVFESDAFVVLLRKMKKKVRTICVPYLVWNVIGTLFYLVITRIPVLANMMNNGQVIELSLTNILGGVFLYKYYYPFWYMAELIILTALSPLFLIVIRKKYLCAISFSVVIMAVFANWNFTYLKASSVLFFMIGATLAIYKKDFWEKSNHHKIFWPALFIAMCIIRWWKIPLVNEMFYCISPIVLWCFSTVFFAGRKINNRLPWFIYQSFFVYAIHVLPVTVVGHVLEKVGSGSFFATVAYIITPVIVLAITYGVATLMSKYMRPVYMILSGNR